MKLLEMFINRNPLGNHFFIVQEGTNRNQHAFVSTDPDVMYRQAIEIIEADRAFEPKLRIFDASRRIVKSESMTITLDTLRRWVKPTAA